MFAAYALGMGVIVTILTVAVALARAGVVARFRRLLPGMNRVAGALLVVAGAYVAYYGWYEIRVLGGASGDPVVDRAAELQGRLQRLVVPDDPVVFTLVAGLVIAVVGAVAAAGRRHRRAGGPAEREGDGVAPGHGGPARPQVRSRESNR
ncbi:MAG: hypothetical protein KatS3mg010_0889 [Acidimicrobiia bacterium]|nr:MAG: hypothetical protein KatS3mg010_0889 [Acidimicrobiia bacterium]